MKSLLELFHYRYRKWRYGEYIEMAERRYEMYKVELDRVKRMQKVRADEIRSHRAIIEKKNESITALIDMLHTKEDAAALYKVELEDVERELLELKRQKTEAFWESKELR